MEVTGWISPLIRFQPAPRMREIDHHDFLLARAGVEPVSLGQSRVALSADISSGKFIMWAKLPGLPVSSD